MSENEVMAIIKQVGYGNRDTGRPCLWFVTHLNEASAALLVFFGKQANDIIQSSGVYDVKELEGKPCWVTRHGRTIKFERLAKI